MTAPFHRGIAAARSFRTPDSTRAWRRGGSHRWGTSLVSFADNPASLPADQPTSGRDAKQHDEQPVGQSKGETIPAAQIKAPDIREGPELKGAGAYPFQSFGPPLRGVISFESRQHHAWPRPHRPGPGDAVVVENVIDPKTPHPQRHDHHANEQRETGQEVEQAAFHGVGRISVPHSGHRSLL